MIELQITNNKNDSFLMSDLASELDALVPNHPFGENVEKARMEALLANYLAMSMAFPYIQAGSCAEAILSCINIGAPMPEHFEKSSIVGAFLVWDELGGWHKTFKKAHAGLPAILDSKAVHANMLKGDLQKLFGHEVAMRFDAPTKLYLRELYKALSSSDVWTRCAAMVTFEIHAERMITALWGAVSSHFGVEKDGLKYFSGHVGGDDPAEAYHVQMTQNMVNAIIEPAMVERFKAEALRLYFMHIQWCKDISNL